MASSRTSSQRSVGSKRKRKKEILSQKKEEARQGAQEAADQALKLLVEGTPSDTDRVRRRQGVAFKLATPVIHRPFKYGFHVGMPSLGLKLPSKSDSASVSSEVSDYSTELAIRRGSSLALIEATESIDHDMHDIDLTTYTEDTTTRASPMRKLKKLRIFKKKSSKGSGSRSRKSKGSRSKGSRKYKLKKYDSMMSSVVTRDAWMCGVCGKVFASQKVAERHEDQCIRNAISRLELQEHSPTYLMSPAPLSPLWTGTLDNSVRGAAFTPTPNGHAETPSPREDESVALDEFHSVQSIPALDYDLFPIAEESQNRSKSIRFSFADLDVDGPVDGPTPDFRSSTDDLLLTSSMKAQIQLTDQALVNTLFRAQSLIINRDEQEAERELLLLSRDKAFYDMLNQRKLDREALKRIRFGTNRKGALSKVQNRFAEAYELIKEGGDRDDYQDQYSRKNKGKKGSMADIRHDDSTLYINVIIKNSIRVVENELDRLAKVRWEDTDGATDPESSTDEARERFERFRARAQANVVKLAGLALASDFTPRRIAVQLSNDLYRLIPPHLKRRGVVMETEIEYRVGPFFVLAVNILSIDWIKLMRITRRDVMKRKIRWRQKKREREGKLHVDTANPNPEEEKKDNFLRVFGRLIYRLLHLTRFEIIAQCLAWLYHVHWTISIPVCWILYRLSPQTMRTYLLTSVTDEIFSYVEEKGMEMEIKVEGSSNQAAFMLSALREIRADDRSKKKKKDAGEEGEEELLGPLLGPAIKEDKEPPNPPPGFEVPENLEFVGLEIELPVGFRRLRWAMLSKDSKFIHDAVWTQECKYENIEAGEWSHHNDEVGLAKLPDSVKLDDLIGAELETSYLMPKSAFVKANTCYETAYLTAYNDYCFCLKKKALTPEVPYGGTFVAWTQLVVTNTGDNTCHMVCSTEAEFPNGPPMVSGQIKSGMRAGTAELFVKIGQTVCKYANEYP